VYEVKLKVLLTSCKLSLLRSGNPSLQVWVDILHSIRHHTSVCIYCIFWTVRHTKILEGKFREKILTHFWNVRCKVILYSIFQEKCTFYGLENTIIFKLLFNFVIFGEIWFLTLLTATEDDSCCLIFTRMVTYSQIYVFWVLTSVISTI
jgi:hypothetical protein